MAKSTYPLVTAVAEQRTNDAGCVVMVNDQQPLVLRRPAASVSLADSTNTALGFQQRVVLLHGNAVTAQAGPGLFILSPSRRFKLSLSRSSRMAGAADLGDAGRRLAVQGKVRPRLRLSADGARFVSEKGASRCALRCFRLAGDGTTATDRHLRSFQPVVDGSVGESESLADVRHRHPFLGVEAHHFFHRRSFLAGWTTRRSGHCLLLSIKPHCAARTHYGDYNILRVPASGGTAWLSLRQTSRVGCSPASRLSGKVRKSIIRVRTINPENCWETRSTSAHYSVAGNGERDSLRSAEQGQSAAEGLQAKAQGQGSETRYGARREPVMV